MYWRKWCSQNSVCCSKYSREGSLPAMLLEAKAEASFVKDYLKHKIGESYGTLKRKAVRVIRVAFKDRFTGRFFIPHCDQVKGNVLTFLTKVKGFWIQLRELSCCWIILQSITRKGQQKCWQKGENDQGRDKRKRREQWYLIIFLDIKYCFFVTSSTGQTFIANTEIVFGFHFGLYIWSHGNDFVHNNGQTILGLFGPKICVIRNAWSCCSEQAGVHRATLKLREAGGVFVVSLCDHLRSCCISPYTILSARGLLQKIPPFLPPISKHVN